MEYFQRTAVEPSQEKKTDTEYAEIHAKYSEPNNSSNYHFHFSGIVIQYNYDEDLWNFLINCAYYHFRSS